MQKKYVNVFLDDEYSVQLTEKDALTFFNWLRENTRWNPNKCRAEWRIQDEIPKFYQEGLPWEVCRVWCNNDFSDETFWQDNRTSDIVAKYGVDPDCFMTREQADKLKKELKTITNWRVWNKNFRCYEDNICVDTYEVNKEFYND